MSVGPKSGTELTRPAEGMIALYRTQISPAIGDRCSLYPSCSEYCMQAMRRHGLLGLAMYADRAVREPDVVRKQQDPVIINGKRKYRDPLEDHDWWMEQEK